MCHIRKQRFCGDNKYIMVMVRKMESCCSIVSDCVAVTVLSQSIAVTVLVTLVTVTGTTIEK